MRTEMGHVQWKEHLVLGRNGKASRQSSVSGLTIACIRFVRDGEKRECGKMEVVESSRSMI